MCFLLATNSRINFDNDLWVWWLIKIKDIKVKRYKVAVTDAMIQNEVERIQTRNGKMTDPEMVESDENVINITFTETDKDGTEIDFMFVTIIDPATSPFEIVELAVTGFTSAITIGRNGQKGINTQ